MAKLTRDLMQYEKRFVNLEKDVYNEIVFSYLNLVNVGQLS